MEREAALRKALLGGRTSALDLPAFDPNTPRGGAARGGGHLKPLELLLREQKEGKLGWKGEEDGSALGERSEPKVLWTELMKVGHWGVIVMCSDITDFHLTPAVPRIVRRPRAPLRLGVARD